MEFIVYSLGFTVLLMVLQLFDRMTARRRVLNSGHYPQPADPAAATPPVAAGHPPAPAAGTTPAEPLDRAA